MPKVTDKNIVLKAMVEFKELGREAFLEKYHFGKAKEHFIVYEGEKYDSKAIYGVAHGLQYGTYL